MTDPEILEPTEAFARLGRIRIGEVDVQGVLEQVAQLAKRTIPDTDEVSVTLVGDRGARTVTATGELARRLDEWQYRAGHGPCLDASDSHTTLTLPDIGAERRWPEWAAAAREAGAGSSLSIGLPIHDTVTGALNVYATRPGAFDSDAVVVGQTFAGYASVALANAHLYDSQAALAQQMQAAMQSRAVIEQAKGIIMGSRRCSPDEAFRLLTKLSQDTNRKLREVAAALVDSATGRNPHR